MRSDIWAAKRQYERENDWARMICTAQREMRIGGKLRTTGFWFKARTYCRKATTWISNGETRQERNRRCSIIGLSLPELRDLEAYCDARLQSADAITDKDWQHALTEAALDRKRRAQEIKAAQKPHTINKTRRGSA